MVVVMSGVFGQYGAEVPLAEDEHPVGALAAYGTHPAFGMGVRPRRLRRGAEDL